MKSKIEPHFEAILADIAGGFSAGQACRARSLSVATWKVYAYDDRFPDRRARLQEAQRQGQASGRFKFQRCTDDQYKRSLQIIRETDVSVRMVDIDYQGGPKYTALVARAKSDAAFAKQFADAKVNRPWGGKAFEYSDADLNKAISVIRQRGHAYYRNEARALGLPNYGQIIKRGKHDAAMLRRYREAVGAQRPAEAVNLLRKQLLSNDLYAVVDAAVPRWLDPDARQDIISDILADTLAGRLDRDDIAASAGKYQRRHDRVFSRFLSLSLDERLFDIDGPTRLDRMSANEWSHEGAI